MYSIVLMAAIGSGPATPSADVPAAPVVMAAAPVYAGCSGCTGYYAGCSGCSGYYAGCCGGYGGYAAYPVASCHGCCGGGGFLGLRAAFHHKSSCHGCGGYSSGYSCFGSCSGSCYGAWPAPYSYAFGGCCGGGYGGYAGGYAGCWGSCYGSYSYPSHSYGASPYGYGSGVYAAPTNAAPAVVVPVEAAPAPGGSDAKKDAEKKSNASLKFQLPAAATLFVDGRPAAGTGAERSFFTPSLEAGQKYFYDVRAELTVGGQTVTEEKRVIVEAGSDVTESFGKLFAAAGTRNELATK